MRYPEKVERWPDRIPDVRYLEKVERRWDKIPDVRYLEKVERRPDRIPDVRYPEKVNVGRTEFLPGWNEPCRTSQGGPSVCAREREPCDIFLGRIPQVGESLEREAGLVGCMDMGAWVSGFNGYVKE